MLANTEYCHEKDGEEKSRCESCKGKLRFGACTGLESPVALCEKPMTDWTEVDGQLFKVVVFSTFFQESVFKGLPGGPKAGLARGSEEMRRARSESRDFFHYQASNRVAQDQW